MREVGSVWHAIAIAIAIIAVGCKGSSSATTAGPSDDGGVTDDASTATDDAGDAGDDGANGRPSETYPAFNPHVPQLQKGPGSVIASPRIVPVYFTGDTFASKMSPFAKGLGASAEWKTAVVEYGVGAATTSADITRTDTPGDVADLDIKLYLSQMLDGTHAEWGSPDASAIYVLFYPSSVNITTTLGKKSCTEFGGYHDTAKMSDGTQIAYAVIPECARPDALDSMEIVVSHELAEAATDPLGTLKPAFKKVDDGDYVWKWINGDAEVGDMCFNLPDSTLAVAGGKMQRMWSNTSAKAHHTPCLPALAGPYFNAYPVLPDTSSLTLAGTPVNATSVKIPVGMSRTIDVQLASDAPTSGPWTVEASIVNGQPGDLVFAFDRTSGQNGEILHLTIEANLDNPEHARAFIVKSTLGSQSYGWIGLVAFQ